MTHRTSLPSSAALKAQARRLRTKLQASGQDVSHSRSLEIVAALYGFKDWNTLSATAEKEPASHGYNIGQRIAGTYLGAPFKAQIIGVEALPNGYTRLKMNFDQPVNIIKFKSFSAHRRRIHCIVDKNGMTKSKTSDGIPHVVLAAHTSS